MNSKKLKIIVRIFLVVALINNVSGQTFPVVPIIENGPPEERINLVFLSEGYTQSELSGFEQDVTQFANFILNDEPYKRYANHFNVYAILVPSNESGADHPFDADDEPFPGEAVEVDTYFDGTFDSFGIHRLLTVDNSKVFAVAADNFPMYDELLVYVNTEIRGGSGGSIAVSYNGPEGLEIMNHEIGHSMHRLEDEYNNSSPSERANLTMESNPALIKWKNWLTPETDIGVVQHCCTATQLEWYRPSSTCKMRVSAQRFCDVCREKATTSIHELTDVIQSKSPNSGTVSIDNPTTFSVNELRPTPTTLTSSWTLNGTVIGNNTASISISPNDLIAGNNFLNYTVQDETEFIRLDNYSTVETTSWIVTSGAVQNCGVSVSSSNGSITITGLNSNENAKLFNNNVQAVWSCNPWQGTPCTSNEVISNLTAGATYFVSVQSDVCDEWIPIVVQGGGTNPTCNDGIQNQGETGIDCGGPCAPCNGGGCNVNITSSNGGVSITV